MKLKLSVITLSLLALSLVACNGGGGGGSSSNGGGDNNVTIKTLATLSSTNTPYSPTCMYRSQADLSWYLVKNDGSGTGVQYFESTGTVNNVSGLTVLTTSDTCQANDFQLTWVNNSNATTVNIYDMFSHTTTAFNLSNAGVAGSQVASSSFAYDSNANSVVANNNFTNNNFGLSQFVGTSPTSYISLAVGAAGNVTNSVMYGFRSFAGGSESTVGQLLPASAPANPAQYIIYRTDTQDTIATINFVNSQGNPISAMTAAVDFIPAGSLSNKYVIQTGLVQPTLYVCSITSTVGNVGTATCGTPITSSLLANQYKIMRLLSYNGMSITFYGLNMLNQTIGIFTLTQN